jgi:glycosyltransferase involved in cell wall biosynthesis
MTKVTVLMTVYNGMPFVQQAVQSILDQTLTDWRCVIVNDGSSDGTSNYLESLNDERIVIVHQANAGISVALNNGLEHCATPYIARLDADDVAVPTRLAEQLAYLEANPKVGLVGTQVVPMGERRLGRSLKLPLDHDAIMRALRLGRHAVVHSSIMVRANLLRQIGGYWPLPMGEEYDMMLRLGEVSQLANLNRVLLHYRVHQASLTNNSMRLAQFRIALACELAHRRRAGLPPIGSEEFYQQQQSRPWWRRAAETCDIHARLQYRLAVAEMYGHHPIRGRARLAWAALCSPRLTVERVVRMARASPNAQTPTNPCSQEHNQLASQAM